MDDERAAREALRRGANPSFVDRAREEAARAGARDDAGARTTTKVRRHRAGKSVEARDEEEEEEEDALGFAKPRAAGTRGRAAEVSRAAAIGTSCQRRGRYFSRIGGVRAAAHRGGAASTAIVERQSRSPPRPPPPAAYGANTSSWCSM